MNQIYSAFQLFRHHSTRLFSLASFDRLFAIALMFAFLTLWYFQVVRSGWCNDESAHIPAGLYALETGRTDAYRVNPPLPRMIAAIPLLLDRPKIQWHYSQSPYSRIEYQFADLWVSENAEVLPRQLFWSRSTVLLFFALGMWSIVRWANQMYGREAAWLAAILWSFNPDVITHSAVVAPDLPAAASGLFVGYVFWNWLRAERGTRPFPWGVAAAVALAILCKFTWLFLLLMLPVIALVVDWMRGRGLQCCVFRPSGARSTGDRMRSISSVEPRGQRPARYPRKRGLMGTRFNRLCRINWGNVLGGGVYRSGGAGVGNVFHDAGRLVLAFSLTVFLINWCYGFDGTLTQLGDFRFISKSLAGDGLTSGDTGNRFTNSMLGAVPVPFPAEMIRGIDFLKWEFEKGMSCYLNGQWQERGWWYFYLYAMLFKMPIGYCVLIAAGVIGLLRHPWRDENARSLPWLPLLFAIAFIGLVSSQTGFTHHVRYVLPAYGFLFLLASRTMVVLPRRIAIGLVVGCISGTLWFHATHLGLAHTCFQPLAGGANAGWRHLSYSNVDWGQSTYRMVDWVKSHPEQRPMTILFRSSRGNPVALLDGELGVSGEVAGIAAGVGAARQHKGWYLVSSFQMTLRQNEFFRTEKPVARPSPDVLLFYVP